MWRYGLVLFSVVISFAIDARPIQLVTEHLAPFQIVHPDGSVTGVNTDLVRRVFAHAKLPYKISSNEWTVSYKQALKEPDVCIYSLAKVPERLTLFKWVGHLNTIQSHFYSLAEKNIQIDKMQDALSYTVAALEDDFSYLYLMGLGFELHKNMYPLSSREKLLSILVRRPDTVDFVMLSDELFERQALPEHRQMIKKHDEFLVAQTTFYLACSLGTSDQYVDLLRRALKQVKLSID